MAVDNLIKENNLYACNLIKDTSMAVDNLIKENNLYACRWFNEKRKTNTRVKGEWKRTYCFGRRIWWLWGRICKSQWPSLLPLLLQWSNSGFFFFKQSTSTIIGGSCHKYHFHDINVLSWQTHACREKTWLLSGQSFFCDKHIFVMTTFVATNII